MSFVCEVRGGREGFHGNILIRSMSSNNEEFLFLTRKPLSWNKGQEWKQHCIKPSKAHSEVQVREGTSPQLFQVPTSLQQTTLSPTPGSCCRHAGRTSVVRVQDKDRPSWRPKSLVLAVQGHLSLTSPSPRLEPRWTKLWVATAKKHTPVIYGSRPTYTQFTPLTAKGTRSPQGNGWTRTLGWWEDVYSV